MLTTMIGIPKVAGRKGQAGSNHRATPEAQMVSIDGGQQAILFRRTDVPAVVSARNGLRYVGKDGDSTINQESAGLAESRVPHVVMSLRWSLPVCIQFCCSLRLAEAPSTYIFSDQKLELRAS